MATDTVQANTGLAQLLRRELQHVRDLTQALHDEQTSLASNDHQALVDVIARKQVVIDDLNRTDKARAELLRAAGCGADHNGVASYIARQPDASRRQLGNLWDQLLKAVAECQQRNLVNGSIIGMNLRHCAHAVSVLCGQDPRQELYDPRGNASSTQTHGRPVKA